LSLEAMQGGVQRPGIHLERVGGVRRDHLGDAVTVAWTPAQRLEDDHVERTLEQLDARQSGL